MHEVGAGIIIVAEMASSEATEVGHPSSQAGSGSYLAAHTLLFLMREPGRCAKSVNVVFSVAALPHTGLRSQPCFLAPSGKGFRARLHRSRIWPPSPGVPSLESTPMDAVRGPKDGRGSASVGCFARGR